MGSGARLAPASRRGGVVPAAVLRKAGAPVPEETCARTPGARDSAASLQQWARAGRPAQAAGTPRGWAAAADSGAEDGTASSDEDGCEGDSPGCAGGKDRGGSEAGGGAGVAAAELAPACECRGDCAAGRPTMTPLLPGAKVFLSASTACSRTLAAQVCCRHMHTPGAQPESTRTREAMLSAGVHRTDTARRYHAPCTVNHACWLHAQVKQAALATSRIHGYSTAGTPWLHAQRVAAIQTQNQIFLEWCREWISELFGIRRCARAGLHVLLRSCVAGALWLRRANAAGGRAGH